MNIVQEWLAAHNNFEQSTLKHNIAFFNKIISVKYKNKFILIDLLEIADFLNIFILVNPLLIFISIKLCNFSPSRIHNFLNNKSVGSEFKHRIYFHICEQKFYSNLFEI